MDQERVTRKLRAILSADVQGYSRLMGDDEVATVKTITEYREIFSSIVTQHNGRVVDSPGDNILSEFASVVDAVQCAVEIQNVLKSKNEELPENRRMIFRIGVNLGDVIQEGDRIYGDGVNIAARIESLAEGGGICISGTAYDHIKNKLALGYNYLGEHSVKNISEPVRVYKVPMGPEDVGKTREPKQWKNAAIAVAVVLILGVAAAAIWKFYLRPITALVEVASKKISSTESSEKATPLPLPEKPSIAVLPFVNISGDPKEDYLSDGITEQVITALSKTPKLFVIARNSVFTYKGKPVKVQQVSKELGVSYVLEGSVQKSGDRLRITAQLIEAKTGNHVWAEKYDRELKDIFALQDEIAMNIMTALQVKLTEGEQTRVYRRHTKNIEAYSLLLKAREHVYSHSKQGLLSAKELLKKAIALDPNYTTPYEFLAHTHLLEAQYGWSSSPAESLKRALELSQKILDLDSSNASVHGLLCYYYYLKKEYEKAVSEAAKAIALDPNDADGYGLMGVALAGEGKFNESISLYKKAIALNPIPPTWYLMSLGWVNIYTGRNHEANAVFRKLIISDPKYSYGYVGLGCTLIFIDKPGEAVVEFDKALNMNPNLQDWLIANRAIALAGIGKLEEAITTVQELVSRRPDDAEIYMFLSMALMLGGRYEEALQMSEKGVSLLHEPRLIFTLGMSYLMLEKYDQAIPEFNKSIQLWPDFLYSHVYLANACSLAGRMEEARAEVAEVLRINPKYSLEDFAKNGYFNYRLEDKERLIDALRKVGLK